MTFCQSPHRARVFRLFDARTAGRRPLTTGAGGAFPSAILRRIVSCASGVDSEQARVVRISSTLSRDTTAKLHLRRFVLWSLPVTYGAQRGRTTMAISFKGAHFPQEIILMGVRWYVAYPLSYRHVEELMQERGVPVDHATIQRWVVKYSPLLEEAFHRRKRPVWVSWRMDETYIKVKGQWYYLYRAVDKHGQTSDFLLTEHRDTEAALRFLKKAIRRNGLPETLTIDGSDANEAAIKRYNEEHGTAIAIRQVKYLNEDVSNLWSCYPLGGREHQPR